jgi:hypothetical protein
MVFTFTASYANSTEFAVMRRWKHRIVLLESLESRALLSSSAAATHLELSRPVHAELLKADDAVASEGMITGSADAFMIGIELNRGTAVVRPLGSLRVSSGVSAYMFLRNPQGAVNARVAVGFVDLEKPRGHQWVAELTLEATQPDTTYGTTNAIDYALRRWIPASSPGGSGSFGDVIRSGTGTLRFPDGVPVSGEAAVPFNIILHSSH